MVNAICALSSYFQKCLKSSCYNFSDDGYFVIRSTPKPTHNNNSMGIFVIISVQTCFVDGKPHCDGEKFESGVDGCAKCICLKGDIKCDASECQPIISSNSVSNENYDTNDIPSDSTLSTKNMISDLTGDPIDDFTQFTENLYKKYLNDKSNPTDYTDMKDKIIGYLAEKDYESNKGTNSSGPPCVKNLSYSYSRFQNLSSYLTKPDYVVKDLYEKRFEGIKDKLNKIIIHSSDTQVENRSPSIQEASSPSYSISVSRSVSVTITKTHDFSASAGIQIAFFNASASYKFTKTETVTSDESESLTVTAPSQKIILGPKTKMNVTYNFYQYDDIYSYFLDFELDDKSTFSRPNFRYMYYGDSNCCKPCLLFKTSTTIDSSLKTFFGENIDALRNVAYKNETVVKIQEKDGKFILRNIPATEKMQNFGIEVVYGEAEPI